MQREAMEQTALFEWINLAEKQHPELELIYAVPNGGSRHKLEAINLKRQGVRAGVPDICLPVANRDYAGLYIELKVAPNKPTEKQLEWIDKLRSYGHKVEVCYSSIDAIKVILEYLKG